MVELARATRAANRSISRLKDRGWVQLRPVYTLPAPGKLRTLEVNSLSPDGVEVVRRLYQEAWDTTDVVTYSTGQLNPIPETIVHDLAIRDALIFLTRLCLGAGIPIHWFTFQTRELIQARQTVMRHAPDLIMIVGERRVPLLVEADLGTESIESAAANSWATKYQQYVTYLKKDFGNDPLFEDCAKPLVVTLTTSARRLGNLVSAIAGWGGQRSWWCTTCEAINPLFYRSQGWFGRCRRWTIRCP